MKTPILFIIFNRPETTKQVFEAIRTAKPKQLFIAADGPRETKDGEANRCFEAREIATNVDWDCEVKTLFRNENIGCGRGPAEAITWFFENVEQGIILEDDCLPDSSFFPFCEILLNQYASSDEVMIIGGYNPLGKVPNQFSYSFSKNAGIWGWASWRRAWQKFDYSMKSWSRDSSIQKAKNYFEKSNREKSALFLQAFEDSYKGNNVSWWDYQWYYARILNNGIGIIPSVNLIKNLGFGDEATHTFDAHSWQAKVPTHSISFPLSHPPFIINDSLDLQLENIYNSGNRKSSFAIFKRAINYFKKIIAPKPLTNP